MPAPRSRSGCHKPSKAVPNIDADQISRSISPVSQSADHRWRTAGKAFVSLLILAAGTVSSKAGIYDITIERRVVNVTGRERVGERAEAALLQLDRHLRESRFVVGKHRRHFLRRLLVLGRSGASQSQPLSQRATLARRYTKFRRLAATRRIIASRTGAHTTKRLVRAMTLIAIIGASTGYRTGAREQWSGQ